MAKKIENLYMRATDIPNRHYTIWQAIFAIGDKINVLIKEHNALVDEVDALKLHKRDF